MPQLAYAERLLGEREGGLTSPKRATLRLPCAIMTVAVAGGCWHGDSEPTLTTSKINGSRAH